MPTVVLRVCVCVGSGGARPAARVEASSNSSGGGGSSARACGNDALMSGWLPVIPSALCCDDTNDARGCTTGGGGTAPTATVVSLNSRKSILMSVSVPSGLPLRRSTTFQLPSVFCVTR